MKKTYKILYLFLGFCFLFISTQKTLSQLYFPLKVGNRFIYHYYHYTSGGSSVIYDYICRVTKDTIAENKLYYLLIKSPFSNYIWVRVDSLTGSLYYLDTTNSCAYYNKERLIDSLLMPLNGTSNNCSVMSVTSIQNVTQWGINSIQKYFHHWEGSGYSINDYRNYNSFLGLVYKYYTAYYSGFIYEDQHTMKGCVINGVVYGDTVLTGIYQIISKSPGTFRLFQNYPNPFNPVTKIRFDVAQHTPYPLSRGENVTLKVYDILGKEITTLVNEQLQPGSYEVTFDGSNLPSGVYFYQLRTGDFVNTKKLILFK